MRRQMKPTLLGAKADLLVMHDAPRRSDIGVTVGEWDQDGRRWQMTRVFRSPNIIDFKRDLGPASAFVCGPIMIVGSTDWSDPDTCGTLWDMAEDERHSTGLVNFLEAKRQESTLITDAIAVEEMKAEFTKRNRRSVAGLKESLK
jgi:hypothetical protein